MTNKIEIRGTGNQAPYGIGEIIKIVPAAHWRKTQQLVSNYYNPPTMHCASCGRELDWTYNGMDVDGIEECTCHAKK